MPNAIPVFCTYANSKTLGISVFDWPNPKLDLTKNLVNWSNNMIDKTIDKINLR